MRVEVVAQSIQIIIAPTVMVSACTLIQNGVLGRYSTIGNRMRSLARERADFLAATDVPIRLCKEALTMIDHQLLELSHRHRLIQNTVLVLYLAILTFLSSMLIIALAQMLDLFGIAIAALVLFLLGTSVLFIGVLMASCEVRISHKSIQSEMKWIMTLAKGQ